ncbi:MAG TPA: LysR family transcriptional regulator [Ancylobacter sp.]
MTPIDIAGLDAFAAIARHRSFRRAAMERGVSASTLSQTLRTLEERLGMRLLNRTTRSVTPTEAGERLLARLVPVLSELGEAVDAINALRDTPTGTLRLNVPAPVARLVLAPLVAEFLRLHPGLTLEIHVETAFVDVVGAGFDAGARYGESLAQDMIALPMGEAQRYGVFAAPSYLATHERPTVPEDLLRHACIRHRFPSGAPLPWEFEKDGREVRIQPPGQLISSDPDIELRAAIDGAGCLMTFEGFARPAVEAGQLVELLADWCPPFPGPYLYYPSRRLVPAPLRAFIDFIKARN